MARFRVTVKEVSAGLGFVVLTGAITGIFLAEHAPNSKPDVAAGIVAARHDKPREAFAAVQLEYAHRDHQRSYDCTRQVASTQLAGFLRAHPCRLMERGLISGHDRAGHCFVVSIIWIEWPDTSAVTAFRNLYQPAAITQIASTRVGVTQPDFHGARVRFGGTKSQVVAAEAVGCAPAGISRASLDIAAQVSTGLPRP